MNRALAAALTVAACSHSVPVAHDVTLPCGDSAACPAGMFCTSDNTCWTPPTLPPPPPESIEVTTTRTLATVTWSAVAGATGYGLWLQRGTSTPTYLTKVPALTYTYDLAKYEVGTAFTFIVQSYSAAGANPRGAAAPFVVAPNVPSMSVIEGIDGVSVTVAGFDPNTTYSVYKAATSDGPFTRAASIGGNPTPVPMEEGEVAYLYVDARPNGASAAAAAAAQRSPVRLAGSLPGPPPSVTGACVSPRVLRLTWPAVPRAEAYSIQLSNNQYLGPQSGTLVDVPFSNIDSYSAIEVTALSLRGGRPGRSARYVIPLDPPAVASIGAVPGETDVTLSWPASPGALRYDIWRSATLVGSTTGLEFHATDLPRLVDYSWRAIAVGPCAVGYRADAPSVHAMAISRVDAENRGSGTPEQVPFGEVDWVGQDFTVNTTGILDGIELPTTQAPGTASFQIVNVFRGDEFLASLTKPSAPATLQPLGDLPARDVIAANLGVRAGDELRVRFVYGGGVVAAAPSAAGRLEVNGVRDPAHDAIFRTYVWPSSQLTAPKVNGKAGLLAARLWWDRPPGATSYAVLRNGVQVGTTTDVEYEDAPVPAGAVNYTVKAIAGAQSATSQTWGGTVTGGAVALLASGDGGTRRRLPANHLATQTFVVPYDGVLGSVHVAAIPSPGTSHSVSAAIKVVDALGKTLASTSLFWTFDDCCSGTVLTPRWNGPMSAFSGTAPLKAGDVLRIELSAARDLDFIDVPDAYDGTLTFDGAEIAGRDLAIKVVMQ